MSEMTKDQEMSSEHENAGRRRLVRGAVAFAPLVLTLRSGGLAAASAGAAVVAYGTLSNNGKITITSRADRRVQAGDRCVTNYVKSPRNEFRISSGAVDNGVILQNDNGNLKCGSFKAANNGTTVQIAILSSASVTSLL